jgi:hypothetical protein
MPRPWRRGLQMVSLCGPTTNGGWAALDKAAELAGPEARSRAPPTRPDSSFQKTCRSSASSSCMASSCSASACSALGGRCCCCGSWPPPKTWSGASLTGGRALSSMTRLRHSSSASARDWRADFCSLASTLDAVGGGGGGGCGGCGGACGGGCGSSSCVGGAVGGREGWALVGRRVRGWWRAVQLQEGC